MGAGDLVHLPPEYFCRPWAMTNTPKGREAGRERGKDCASAPEPLFSVLESDQNNDRPSKVPSLPLHKCLYGAAGRAQRMQSGRERHLYLVYASTPNIILSRELLSPNGREGHGVQQWPYLLPPGFLFLLCPSAEHFGQ